jgi:hypothetical protein
MSAIIVHIIVLLRIRRARYGYINASSRTYFNSTLSSYARTIYQKELHSPGNGSLRTTKKLTY